MLELQNLSRSFRGIPAIHDVTVRVGPGEVVGFLGPNGAGKSTTVKIITGLLRPNYGRVLFEGEDIRNDLVGFRAVLGYVPEEAHLYTHLSSLEYLQLVGRLRGMKESLIEVKAKKLLQLLNLASWQYSTIASYELAKLMELANLESVFAQLVQQQDTKVLARELVEVMKIENA